MTGEPPSGSVCERGFHGLGNGGIQRKTRTGKRRLHRFGLPPEGYKKSGSQVKHFSREVHSLCPAQREGAVPQNGGHGVGLKFSADGQDGSVWLILTLC